MLYNDLKSILKLGGPLVLLFLILMTTNILNIQLHLRLLVIFSLILFIYPLLIPRFKWDGIAYGLLGFSIFYTVIANINGEVANFTNMISYFFAPTAFYLFGKLIVRTMKNTNQIFTLLIISFFLFAATLYYNIIVDISIHGFGGNIFRTIGEEKDRISATLLGVVASLGLAGVIVFIKPNEYKSYKWWLLTIMMICSLMTVMHLINRTGIVVIIGNLIITLLFYSKWNILKIIIPILLAIAIIYILIEEGFINSSIFEAYESRNERQIGGIQDAGDRSWRWIDAINKLFSHPFGWSNELNLSYNYVHNGWLDIARIAGILPFLFYTITNIIVLVKFWQLIKKHLNKFFALYLIALNITFFLTIFVEPIIEGQQTYFYLYSMLWGIQIEMLNEGTLNNTEQSK